MISLCPEVAILSYLYRTYTFNFLFPASLNVPMIQQEATRKYFGGKRPAVSKTSALTVFSYFSNEDTYNASLVSKQWNELAFDNELWQLE